MACPAAAQVNLVGYYNPIYDEDFVEIPGPDIGDYAGLPISEAARRRANTWDASLVNPPAGQKSAPATAMPSETFFGEEDALFFAPRDRRPTMTAGTARPRAHGRQICSWRPSIGLCGESASERATGRVPGHPMPAHRRVCCPLSVSRPAADAARGCGDRSHRHVAPLRSCACQPEWLRSMPPSNPFGMAFPGGSPRPGGALKVVTTKLSGGWLRRNGVPYSANAVETEYFDRFPVPNGGEWFVVTTVVEDPMYLRAPS